MQNYCGFTAHSSSQLLCYTMRTPKVLLTFAGSLCVLLSKILGFLENRQKKMFYFVYNSLVYYFSYVIFTLVGEKIKLIWFFTHLIVTLHNKNISFMKRGFLFLILTFLSVLYTKAQEEILMEPIRKDTIRLLTIGNSFSQDAVEQYLYELAKEVGIHMIIGNAYKGGQSLEQHWTDMTQEHDVYEYRKVVNGVRYNMPRMLLPPIITDEQWDFISFQQASHYSGLTTTYEPYLSQLIQYTDSIKTGQDVQYGWHMTWAYSKDSNHGGFANYSRSQEAMYDSIRYAVQWTKILHPEFSFNVPCGTAIQNARTSYLGDNLCREGVLVVSDEIHCDMLLEGRRHIPFASVSDEARQNCITLQAPSKTFNMPGIVVSQAIVYEPKKRRKFFTYIEGNDFDLGNVFAYDCAAACYSPQGLEWKTQMLDYVQGNIDLLCERLQKECPQIVPIRPQASFLVFLDCTALGFKTQGELEHFFAFDAKVGMNSGAMFGKGGVGFMRLNVGSPRSIVNEAIDRIINALKDM